jgi:hypothetical protein
MEDKQATDPLTLAIEGLQSRLSETDLDKETQLKASTLLHELVAITKPVPPPKYELLPSMKHFSLNPSKWRRDPGSYGGRTYFSFPLITTDLFTRLRINTTALICTHLPSFALGYKGEVVSHWCTSILTDADLLESFTKTLPAPTKPSAIVQQFPQVRVLDLSRLDRTELDIVWKGHVGFDTPDPTSGGSVCVETLWMWYEDKGIKGIVCRR